MHGRKKIIDKEDVSKYKKIQEKKKLETFETLEKKFKETNSPEEKLKISEEILRMNPEYYSLWNFREENSLLIVYEEELKLIQDLFRISPKSYWLWKHRVFIVNKCQTSSLLKKELELCEMFLNLDCRNCIFFSIYKSSLLGLSSIYLGDDGIEE